jgi:RNA polymerase sigma factor (sigma-70 family)
VRSLSTIAPPAAVARQQGEVTIMEAVQEDDAEGSGDAPAGEGRDDGHPRAKTRPLPPEAEGGVLAWLRRLGRRLGITSEEAEFRELYERHKHEIWACVNGPRISEAMARDLFQEVCLITAQREEGLPRPVMPYVREVVRKLKANLRAKQRPEVELPEEAPTSRPGAERLLVAAEIVTATLAKMRPNDAWIVRAIDLDGSSYEDVARHLGCSERNAVLRHHRAKKRFAKLAEPLHKADLGGEP